MKKIFFEIIAVLGVFILFVILTISVWIYFRGAQQLDISEARGITFWQLIRERWNAWSEINTHVSAQPLYAGCRNNITHFLLLNMRSAFNYTYASLNPDSKLAQAFHHWETHKPDPLLPVVEPIQWHQAPDAFWEYFSRAYWRALVTTDSMAGECQLGALDFAAILGTDA